MKAALKKLDLIGLGLLVGALVAYSIRSVWSPLLTALAVAGGALLLAGLAAKAGDLGRALRLRSTRFGVNSVVSVLLLVGVLGFVNYLAARNPQRIDLTSERIYSLSEQSSLVLDQLEEEVRIRAFYPAGENPPAEDVLDLYAAESPRIRYEFIDPDREPQLAEQYDVTVYGVLSDPFSGTNMPFGTVILEMAGRTERIETQSQPLDENQLTNALMRLVRDEIKTIYFVEGHGEPGIANPETEGLERAAMALERENYVVEPLNLITAETVPDDAAVVVWAGPRTAPFPEEVEQIKAFLERGGSLLLMLEPSPAPSFTELLSEWSITPGENLILDVSGVGRLFGFGAAVPLVTEGQYESHAITARFPLMTFFPRARSIDPPAEPLEGVQVQSLFSSTPNSWGETDFQAGGEAGFDPGEDQEGPVSMAVAATRDPSDEESARLVVVGDAEFASNRYFDSQGNGALFINMVRWLAEDEDFISIEPKTPEDRPLFLTASQGRMSFYISMLLLPLLVLALGVAVWMKRRRQ